MKFNPLAVAILLASTTTLISCGDDDKKPEAKQTAPVAAIDQQKSVEKIDLAEVAEARYRNLATIANQTITKVNQSGRSPWKDMKVVIEDYQRGDNQATARETATLTPNANFGFVNNPVIITSKSTIAYSPELLKQGVVAQVNYHDLDMSSFLDNFNSPPELKDIIDTISSHLDIQADLLTDNNAKTTIKINPFTKDFGTEKGEDITLDIQGADATFAYNEKEIVEHLGAGKWVAHVKPIEIKPKQKEGLLSFKGFDFEQTLTPDGDLEMTVSPLQVTFVDDENEGGTIDIAGITEKGTGVVFDSNLGGFLGKVSGEIGDISFTAKKDGQKITFGNSHFDSQTLKNEQGNYDLSGDTDFNFNGQSLQEHFGLPLLLKHLTIHGDLKNLSPETLEVLTKFSQLEQVEDKETQEKMLSDALNALVNNLSLNKTHLDGAIALTTEKGDANIDFSLALNGAEGSLNLVKAIEDSGENLESLFRLLQENIEFKADIKINREILAAFGMAELVEMQAGDMITNNNGILTVTVENHGDGLKINGKPMF